MNSTRGVNPAFLRPLQCPVLWAAKDRCPPTHGRVLLESLRFEETGACSHQVE